MTSLNMWLAGFFACAAVHYSIHWSRSRQERVLLVFAIQCAMYTVFHLAIGPYFSAKTVAECQVALDRFVIVGVLVHVVTFQLYANLGGRRDYLFRGVCTAVLLGLVLLHHWEPLRGRVLELRTVNL